MTDLRAMIGDKDPVVTVPGVLFRALHAVPVVGGGQRVPGHGRGFVPRYDTISGLCLDPVVAHVDDHAGINARIRQSDVRHALCSDGGHSHGDLLLGDCQPGLERCEGFTVVNLLPATAVPGVHIRFSSTAQLQPCMLCRP